jgi:TfoX/Sxy family transcriptional regulator of competence genes
MSDFDHLAGEVRSVLALDPRLSERKMFGGLGFMLNGNMALGVTSKGALMVRLGKDNDTRARALPGADQVDFAAKRMGGFLIVGQDALEDDGNLDRWIALALDFTATLPPK